MSVTIHHTRLYALVAAAVLAALLSAGCSDIEVQSAWANQSAARSSVGRTFAWLSQTDPTIDDLEGVQPALRDVARQVVEQAYAAKGYKKGDAQNADFLLRCRVAKATRGDRYSANTFEQYTEGTLVLYMVDPSTKAWFWRAWATARLQEENPPEQKRARLEQAVGLMVKDLPDLTKASGAK